MEKHPEPEFYGTATVGEKGQVVIPIEGRSAIDLKPGDKVIVFGMGDMLICAKLQGLQKMAAHVAGKLKGIRSVIKKVS